MNDANPRPEKLNESGTFPPDSKLKKLMGTIGRHAGPIALREIIRLVLSAIF